MIKFLTRPASVVTRQAFINQPSRLITRKMSSNPAARTNEELTISKLFDVSHINAVVTGGGTGIGLMITQVYRPLGHNVLAFWKSMRWLMFKQALAANGAKVYITGRREEALNKVVEQYNTGSGMIIALPGDISSKEDVKRLAEVVASKESKGIHLLVNNAGITKDANTSYSKAGKPDFSSAQAISEHLMQSEPEQWSETFQTNLTAQFFTSAAFLPLLAKGRDVTPGYTSSIVNIASISGVMKGSSGGQFAYGASKAGM